MNNSQLIDAYADGPSTLRHSLRDAEANDLDLHPIEGRWSIREVVCHLADAEIIYADRIKRVLAEQNPVLFEADPNQFRPALHCPQRPLNVELGLIDCVRKHMLPILRSLDAESFQRMGSHSLEGGMTLQTLLQRITHHIPHHVSFINEKISAIHG